MSHNFLLNNSGTNPGVVSMNLNDTWTGKSFLEIIRQQSHSRSLSVDNLSNMRFQQKQQVEKEQKKIDLLGNATVRVGRISSSHEIDETKLLTSSIGAGKVRQMFEERRTGVDKSYPLKPISGNVGKATATTTTTNGVKAPPKSKSMNGIVLRQKPVVASHIDNNEFHHLDRDPLNNTVTPSRYNSTNRVPSLKNNSVTSSNGNAIISNNNHHAVDGGITKQQFKQTSTSGGTNRAITPSTATANYPLMEKKTVETRKSIPNSGNVGQRETPIRQSPAPVKTPPKSAPRVATPPEKEPKKSFAPPPEGMVQCSICGRNFLEDRIAKHQTICEKTAAKKRKVFDSTKARVQGTEAEVYVKKATKSKTKAVEQKIASKKGDWRKKHEDFINAIRAAKEVQAHIKAGKDIRDLPPPPPSDYSDYVQCPHCSRKFNETAAERHIPKCANMLHNKTKPKPIAKGRR